ncbi:zf-TFIIB domain-containing protein [Cellulomonas denverensis]|uniref:Transcription factor zinc-finger domain-containing protein n=1 Tax=Cellulomonas denverensis TaxID=264297 RepID=A0A7X6KXZ3_9CELL|nr:zf-TFIIB domain-containing protein [Cellulomonas denverensis]NKY24211.1 hypothetical protein [Cellulomonas denverensis]GIG24874.1 hypothetical protein Cde04nite_11180 [Cellulomonas denverensis]
MRCPTDGAELVMSERQGIEIDYCPSCRGIWLDRGELDKILERASGAPAPGLPVDPLAPAADPRAADPRYAPGPGYPPDPRYAPEPGYAPDPRGGYEPGYRDPGYRDDRRYDRGYDPRYDKRRKRKESWLEDLFDFG